MHIAFDLYHFQDRKFDTLPVKLQGRPVYCEGLQLGIHNLLNALIVIS